jgi:hypothetical protein
MNVSLISGNRWYALLRRRFWPNHASVRSTLQRFGKTWKPLEIVGRSWPGPTHTPFKPVHHCLTISTVVQDTTQRSALTPAVNRGQCLNRSGSDWASAPRRECFSLLLTEARYDPERFPTNAALLHLRLKQRLKK